jgi:hypothetical protein
VSWKLLSPIKVWDYESGRRLSAVESTFADSQTLIETEVAENMPDGEIVVATTTEIVVVAADVVWPNNKCLPLPPPKNSWYVESFWRLL